MYNYENLNKEYITKRFLKSIDEIIQEENNNRLFEDIDEEELKKWSKEFKEYEEEKYEFAVNKIDRVMEQIYEHLKFKELIDKENILHFPLNYLFTEKEFLLLFRIIIDFSTDKEMDIKEDENYVSHFKYKEMCIATRIMYGQVTSMQMWKLKEEDVNYDVLLNYQDIKDECLNFNKDIL